MKNKVLIDAERTRYLSGIALICRNLAQGLQQTSNNNMQVTFYGDPKTFSAAPFALKKWKFWHRFKHSGLSHYKLVHIFHQSSHYFPAKFKAKKMVTLHDLNFLHEKISDQKKQHNIRRVKNNLWNADTIVCISEFVKQDYLKNRHLFNPKNDQEIVVIHNGLKFPDISKTYDLGEYEFLNSKKFYLNIGVLHPKKNQLSLVKTFRSLNEDLVFVVSDSKKEYESTVLEFIKANQLENRVHILRNISTEAKHALLQRCEAMLHPSLAEGFGIPPIEAMHFGKPVFLSKLTSLPEIGGPHAFYFDNFQAEHMAEKIKNGMETYRSDKNNYSFKLKEWAQQFDYRKMAEEYVKLYQKLLSTS